LVRAVLVLPLARLQAPLDVDLRALLEVLARDLGELAEEGDPVPFRLLLLLPRLVLPLLRGRDGDVGDRAAVGHVARLGIAPEVADEDDLDDRCHVGPFLDEACWFNFQPRAAAWGRAATCPRRPRATPRPRRGSPPAPTRGRNAGRAPRRRPRRRR